MFISHLLLHLLGLLLFGLLGLLLLGLLHSLLLLLSLAWALLPLAAIPLDASNFSSIRTDLGIILNASTLLLLGLLLLLWWEVGGTSM